VRRGSSRKPGAASDAEGLGAGKATVWHDAEPEVAGVEAVVLGAVLDELELPHPQRLTAAIDRSRALRIGTEGKHTAPR
jgi:hypothetical protein